MAWAAALDRMITTVRDTFPQAVVYDPAGGAHALTGIYDEAHEGIETGGDGLPVTTTHPMLELRVADLTAVGVTAHVRDQIQIGAATMEVVDVQPDGSGMVRLLLVEV